MIDGDVIIFDATTFEDTADVTDVETNIRRDAESGRFVFVSIDDQPRQEITSAAISAPSASVILSTATTATTSIPSPFGFGFLNGEFTPINCRPFEGFNGCSPFLV